mmetsp:Transcript_42280/g.95626  ORF Transcript_42280/g.95626 Transcript_42280/m.95626 type:complete len:230 (+) Transcript_42280:667-1356(+)
MLAPWASTSASRVSRVASKRGRDCCRKKSESSSTAPRARMCVRSSWGSFEVAMLANALRAAMRVVSLRSLSINRERTRGSCGSMRSPSEATKSPTAVMAHSLISWSMSEASSRGWIAACMGPTRASSSCGESPPWAEPSNMSPSWSIGRKTRTTAETTRSASAMSLYQSPCTRARTCGRRVGTRGCSEAACPPRASRAWRVKTRASSLSALEALGVASTDTTHDSILST